MTNKKNEGPTVLNEAVCDAEGFIHGVDDLLKQTDANGQTRIGPRTYCKKNVGFCEVRMHMRAVGTKTHVTCPRCLDILRRKLGTKAGLVLGQKKKKRRRRRKRRKNNG